MIQPYNKTKMEAYADLRKNSKLPGEHFRCEGARLAEAALLTGKRPEAVFLTEAFPRLHPERWQRIEVLLHTLGSCPVFHLSTKSFQQYAETKQPQGIMLIYKRSAFGMKSTEDSECAQSLLPDEIGGGESLFPLDEPLRLMILEDVQDPGNVGTIIRCCDAFSYTTLFYSPGTADPFSSKVLRASMGSLFHIRLRPYRDLVSLLNALHEQQIVTVAAALDGENLRTFVPEKRLALLIGNEGAGLSKVALAAAHKRVRIHMNGQAESLNAAMAAAILTYECMSREI